MVVIVNLLQKAENLFGSEEVRVNWSETSSRDARGLMEIRPYALV